MDLLAARPDSILVSAETVKDFQLLPGDLVNLRLPGSPGGALTVVPFHYVGVVAELPTTSKDSFFVTNAAYLARVGAFLVDAGGRNTAAVAASIRALLGSTASVTDIAETRTRIGSSLTAVDLSALTRVELGFAFALPPRQADSCARWGRPSGVGRRQSPKRSVPHRGRGGPSRWARPQW